jgi:hypothetical protein
MLSGIATRRFVGRAIHGKNPIPSVILTPTPAIIPMTVLKKVAAEHLYPAPQSFFTSMSKQLYAPVHLILASALQSPKEILNDNSCDINDAILFSSTKKKRRTKMNKHKLKKRRKALRMNTKLSRA